MATDGYHIFYNPLWVSKLSLEEAQGVIAHEVMHVIFGHGDRRQNRVQERWNIACDHAVNLLLLSQGFVIPVGGLSDRKFSGMTAEEIYLKLSEGLKYDASDSKNVTYNSGAPGKAGNRTAKLGADLIDHNDPRLKPFQDDDAPDQEQLRQLRNTLTSEMKSHLHGMAAGFFSDEIERAKSKCVPWHLILREWLFDKVRSDWRSYPFAKKHLSRGFFMPSIGLDVPADIVFCIDTSGSMSDHDLALIIGEINSLRESNPSKLTIVQCDAAIQDIKEFEAGDGTSDIEKLCIKGRGGTDFRPVFEWIKNEVDNPMPILVFATDGFGMFPATFPEFPVVWIVDPTGRPNTEFPFGSVFRRLAQ